MRVVRQDKRSVAVAICRRHPGGPGPQREKVTRGTAGDAAARHASQPAIALRGVRIERVNNNTGSRPTATIAIDGSAASASRSSRARL